MIGRTQVAVAVLGAMALGAASHAGMMPISPLSEAPRLSRSGYVTASQEDMGLPCPFDDLRVADLDLIPVASVSDSCDDIPLGDGAPAVHTLSDGQNSFTLCLYALLSLGLCRSTPLVRRLSFAHIPQWYHDGGPFQIGHRLAISPDCLCSAAVCCFVQPAGSAEDSIPRYHFTCVVCVWRNSQFTPAVLAARAPPHLSSRCWQND